MSVEFSEEESRKAVEFLQEFATDRSDIGEDDALPFRLVPFSVSQDELQGQSLEWILEYLRRGKCDEQLAVIIAHQVTSEISETDLSAYKLEHDNQYDASGLARLVFNTVHHVCQKWSQKPPQFYRSRLSYESSVHAIKNTRRKMEDKHITIPDFNSLFGLPKGAPNYAYFAVYDGHGGIDAVTYAATHLHCFLARDPNLATDPGLALHETFQNMDRCFGVRAEAEGLRSGCTAVSVLISDDTMHIAWLGDSQVVLCKDGELIELMEPHKPERQDERERIEALGGCVVWFGAWRVNGTLSVSRAIGDNEHKPYISGVPDVAQYTFDGDEEFLILACDGLWDVTKPDQAIQLVREHIAEGNDRDTVAKLLVDQAKESGSSDNISVLVVFLDAHRKDLSQDQVLTSNAVPDSINLAPNGINGSETSPEKMDTSAEVIETKVNPSCSADSIVATVKISTETTFEKRTGNLTCKVTCKNGNSITGKSNENSPKSAGNSPKCSKKKMELPKSPTRGGGGSLKGRDSKTKGSSPKQLSVSSNKSSRRKSAPDALNM